MTTLAQLKSQLTAIRKHYEEEKARLWRGGRTVFPKIEHEERGRDLRNEMRTRVREIRESAQQIHDEIVAESEYADEFAPDSVLTSSEQAQLQTRLASAEMDCAALSQPALESRLRGVMRNGSDVEKVAYLLAARERERMDTQRRAANEPKGTYRGVTTSTLGIVLRDLEETVIGEKRREVGEQVSNRTEEARNLLDACYLAYHEAENVMQVHARRYLVERPNVQPGDTVSSGGGRIASDRVT